MLKHKKDRYVFKATQSFLSNFEPQIEVGIPGRKTMFNAIEACMNLFKLTLGGQHKPMS